MLIGYLNRHGGTVSVKPFAIEDVSWCDGSTLRIEGTTHGNNPAIDRLIELRNWPRDLVDVRERDVPEQLVLTEPRHLRVEELAGWLPRTIGRLVGVAQQRYGGVSAPVFVIYHGEVNQDSDGPVEVCVPIDATQPEPTDSPTRREARAPRGLRSDHEGPG